MSSLQGQASSPAGREVSCRDGIVGHSASREWTAELQPRFSLFSLAPGPRSPPWPNSERPDSRVLDAGRDAGHPGQHRAPVLERRPDTKAGPVCAWGQVVGLSLVCCGHRGKSARFPGSATLGFGGRENAESFPGAESRGCMAPLALKFSLDRKKSGSIWQTGPRI